MPAGVLLALYDRGAASPVDIWQAVADRWDIVFLYSSDKQRLAEVPGILSRLGHVIDISALSRAELLHRLRQFTVSGVVTFSEPMVRLANALARDLSCTANSPEVTARLTDKYLQRLALNQAGVSTTRVALVGPGSARSAVDAVGLPAVLKPRLGFASQGVRLVSAAAEVAAAGSSAGGQYVLEELLCGARPRESWVGDYVSVETLTISGAHHHLCVTDKLPLDEGFRERGAVLPSGLSAQQQAALAALTAAALDAIGVRTGITHTEIKLTYAGPRIIEVNGRLGGTVHRLMRRAAGASPVAMALDAATGGTAAPPGVRFTSHAASVFALPAPGAMRVRGLAELAELRSLPGVWRVERHASAGDLVNHAAGSLSRVMTVDVEAASRTELASRISLAAAALGTASVYDYLSQDGRPSQRPA